MGSGAASCLAGRMRTQTTTFWRLGAAPITESLSAEVLVVGVVLSVVAGFDEVELDRAVLNGVVLALAAAAPSLLPFLGLALAPRFLGVEGALGGAELLIDDELPLVVIASDPPMVAGLDDGADLSALLSLVVGLVVLDDGMVVSSSSSSVWLLLLLLLLLVLLLLPLLAVVLEAEVVGLEWNPEEKMEEEEEREGERPARNRNMFSWVRRDRGGGGTSQMRQEAGVGARRVSCAEQTRQIYRWVSERVSE